MGLAAENYRGYDVRNLHFNSSFVIISDIMCNDLSVSCKRCTYIGFELWAWHLGN